MATNASTWFYAEPEHNAYLLEERVNHTLWTNRITGLSLDCLSAEPPFRMIGDWRGITVTIEWVPNEYFTLVAPPGPDADSLLVGLKEILGFAPTISYIDRDGNLMVEWVVKQAEARVAEIQGNPNYQSIKRYKN